MTLSQQDSPSGSRTVARPVANLGNTCYMNAVLQALAHSPELCLAMDCESHRKTCPIAAENSAKLRSNSPSSASSHESEAMPRRTPAIRKSRRSANKSPQENSAEAANAIKFCALCELEEHLRSVHNPSMKDKPVSPNSFVLGFIDQVAPWFRLGVQEDSHEFLRLLIDAMQGSCVRARKTESDSGEKTEESKSTRPNEKDTEYPFSLFRGMIRSTVTCGSCHASSSTLDPIEDIGLEVAAPSTHTTRSGSERPSRNASPLPAPTLFDVPTAFQRYASAEELDSGYKCEKCGKVGKATKQSRLASIPPILTLHLKRFRYGAAGVGSMGETTGRRSRSEVGQLLAGSEFYTGKSGSSKIEGHVKFDTVVDLKPFLTPELQEKHVNMLSRLFAVVVHAGKNSHSGHYIAYVRNLSKNEWWKMDDGRVTNVSLDEVCQADAYMLFYRVVQHPVATKLEQEFKTMMEKPKDSEGSQTVLRDEDTQIQTKETNQDQVEMREAVSSTSNTVPPSPSPPPTSTNVVNPRKRRHSLFENGEAWARSKTSMPPRIMEAIREMETYVAENGEFTLEFNGGSTKTVESDEAIRDRNENHNSLKNYDEIRRRVVTLMCSYAKDLEAIEGIGVNTWLFPSSTRKSDNGTDGKLVAVVEPEEEMDVL